MKKADLMVLFGVLVLGAFLLFAGKVFKVQGDTVIITKDGEIFGKYPLSDYAEISVGDKNTVKIENGCVYMHSATCPDKLCIRQGKTQDSSKKIICLPNKVTIEVTKKTEIDKVVR